MWLPEWVQIIGVCTHTHVGITKPSEHTRFFIRNLEMGFGLLLACR